MKNEQIVTIRLPLPPSPGAYHSSPSGDTEYEDACEKHRKECDKLILDAVPRGFALKGVEKKKQVITKHFAELKIVAE